jgi:hypothetical protein
LRNCIMQAFDGIGGVYVVSQLRGKIVKRE